MKRVLAVLLLLIGSALGSDFPYLPSQVCGADIVDMAHVLPSTGPLTDSVRRLKEAGADPRIVTVSTTNLDLVEQALVQNCSDWQGTNGIKSTLVVLMVAPKEHKMGIYFGHAFDSALQSDWNRIKQEEMAPRFKSGQFAEGMIAAMDHIGGRIKAQADEARSPKQTTVVEQPTDLSGLWRFLMWCLAVGSGLGIAIWLVYWLTQKAKRKDQWAHARTGAIMARNHATVLINKLRITDLPKDKVDQFDSLYGRFTDLGNQTRFDPSDEGLQIGEYMAIERAYRELSNDLEQLNWASSGKKEQVQVQAAPPDESYHPSTHKKKTVKTDDDPPAPAPASTNTNNVFAPVIIGTDVGGPDRTAVWEREPDPEPRYREPDPEPSFGGGGSSDFGSSSSDSGSSSDFGSGGSSDFGSGTGSESGGGSDFGSSSGGGGFDSGSGGSSSF